MSCALLVVAKLACGALGIIGIAAASGGLLGAVVGVGFKLYDWWKAR